MEPRNIFKNLSPLDHRYYLSNRVLFDALSRYLSEEAVVTYCLKVECVLLETHVRMQRPDYGKFTDEIHALERTITPLMVYEEEKKTQHNLRALVNVMKRKVSKEISSFVHLGATSVDILDTAQALRIRDAVRKVILPLLLDLLEEIVHLAEQEASTPQVGRTHGQHAVPLTLGFALSEFAARLGKSVIRIETLSSDLRGKFSGAVGAYNASSLLVRDPILFEEQFLEKLGLRPAEYSTQIVEPEYLLRLLLEINTAFGILANLADDLRHLQRTEIDELREFFSETQVGSSTMPQKRNPWNSEHVKSLWKAFSPRVMTFYMDQISEHQRDMSNSASGRFTADYLAGFADAAARMKKIVATIKVDRKRLLENITLHGDLVLAEAAYILLALSGDADAHERVRKITLECEAAGSRLMDVLKKDEKVWNLVRVQLKKTTGEDADLFFSNPRYYRGKAVEKTLILTTKYKKVIKTIRSTLQHAENS